MKRFRFWIALLLALAISPGHAQRASETGRCSTGFVWEINLNAPPACRPVSLSDLGLTPSAGGLIYSTATALAVLAGTPTAGQTIRSGASAAPSWSTFTIPATFAQGDLVHGSATNTLTALTVGASGQMLRSTGTLPAWSTPTFPNTATAGKVLIGDGTNIVLSTPTYPNAAPTAGTFPRGDGTNFVTSTLTLPNALTSGGVLYGSAANVAASSGELGSTQVVLGGGAGAAPNTSANLTFNGINLTLGASAGSLVLSTAQPNSNIGFANITDNSNLGIVAAYPTTATNVGAQLWATPRGTGFSATNKSRVAAFNTDYPANTANWEMVSLLAAGATYQIGGTRLGTGSLRPVHLSADDFASNQLYLDTTGRSGFGVTSPSAVVHFKAGTAAASTGPLKFTTGTSMTTAEAGAVEYTTDDLFFTIATGPARKRFLFADPVGGLTSGRVPFNTTNGRLTDDADLTFTTDTLSATKVAMSSLTSGRVPIVSTAGLLIDDADMTFATDTLTVTKLSTSQITVTNGTEPTCDSSTRGAMVLVQGGAGVADTFRICTKDVTDSYGYRALF